MRLDTPIRFTNARKLKRIIAKLNDEQQIIIYSSAHNGAGTSSVRLTAQELKSAISNPKFYSNHHFLGIFLDFHYHDYYSIEILSDNRLTEVINLEKAEKEIADLAAAGIKGSFYWEDVEFGNPVLLTTPDQVIELADQIKAFRAKKEIQG